MKLPRLVLPVLAILTGSPLAAQVSPPAPPGAPGARPFVLPVRFSGQMTSSGELYHASGIASRRPGQTWRLSLSPQMTLFGQFSMGLNVLLSSEGSDLRQNMSQLGISPRIKWATFHLGDFTQNHTEYTVQGTRIRGAGFDLRPGVFRLSAQGGEAQRTVAGGSSNLAYRRRLYAATAGVGREGSSFIALTVVRAKDDPSSLAPALADTLLLDTIPIALRPRIETRPQDNLVLGGQGRLNLFANRVVLKGEVSGALITRDVESPEASAESVSGGGTVGGLMPLHLSTSGDYAYRVDAETNFGVVGVSGGYEYVGAGYTSLGLAYLINDRRGYRLSGNARLLGGRVSLQSQYQHQNDNLLDQKLATTNRDAITGTVTVIAGRRLTTSLTALLSTTANDAAVDTFRVDNRALALTTNTSLQATLLGRTTVLNLSYALQRTSDANVVTRIPEVTVHNISTSVQVPLSSALSLAPTVSFAITDMEPQSQRNVYLGMRGQGRFGPVRTSLAATQTFSNARGVLGLNGQLSYTLPWQGTLTVQGRHNRYAAIGSRPAFEESFATMSLARSF